MPPRPIPVFTAVGVACTFLLATACSPASIVGPQVASGKIPVVACQTVRGLPQSGPARFGHELQPLPGIDPPLFAYYSDDARQVVPLLGPRGWNCHILVAADGGVSVTLTPGSATQNESANQPSVKITARAEPACEGCIYQLVCAYVAQAKAEIGRGLGPCSETPRTGARVKWLEGSPASTRGGTDVLRVDGTRQHEYTDVILYRWSPGSSATASRETCGLVGSSYSVCDALFNDFRARQWGLD